MMSITKVVREKRMKYVYMVRAGADHYKVGVAGNVSDRMRALQTSNGHAIELVMCRRAVAALELEKKIHKSLQEQKLNGGSEWFTLTPQQAVDLAVFINTMPSLEVADIERLQEAVEDVNANQDVIYRMMEDIFWKVSSEKKPAVGRNKLPDKTIKITHDEAEDELLEKATETVRRAGRASSSMLQRRLKVGYVRAARLIDELEAAGVCGPADGARPREVYGTMLPQATKMNI